MAYIRSALPGRPQSLIVEHEVVQIAPGNYHALGSRHPQDFARFKPAFDLFRLFPHRLYFSLLVDRARYSQALVNGNVGQAGEKGKEFGAAGAVTLDAADTLFEGYAGRQSQRTLWANRCPR